MIPSGKKVSKLYSVFPEDGTGDFTVVTDQKYVTGSTGLLELVPANTPAFDYSDGSGCPALLVETSELNYVKNTEEINKLVDWNYNISYTTLSLNSGLDPNGSNTSDLVLPSTSSSRHYIVGRAESSLGLFTLNDVITISGFFTQGGYKYIKLGGYFGNENALFDLSTGTFISKLSNVLSYTIKYFGNDIYRISVTYTFKNSIGNGYLYAGIQILDNSQLETYVGDGVSGVYVWGMNVVKNNVLSSYIQGIGTWVTRAADVETVTTPAGVTSITETIGGVEQTPITIPINFERASTATRVNEQGLIETVGIDVPRIDYTSGVGTFLVEGASTNLVLWSEDFSNASWIKILSTITANANIAPDGTLTAYKIVENSGSGLKYIQRSTTFTTNDSISIFAKAGERTQLAIGNAAVGASIFDLVLGTVVSSGSSNIKNEKIELYEDGWYRISANVIVSGSFAIQFFISNQGVVNYTGNGTSGLYIWGAQQEVGTEATSYIPTTTTSVTRAADITNGTTPIDLTYRAPNGLINKIIMT